MTKLIIIETGDSTGRSVGDTVYCSEDGNLYRITGISSIVHTLLSSYFTHAEGDMQGKRQTCPTTSLTRCRTCR